MSESIQVHKSNSFMRWQLLSTVSALALLNAIGAPAKAEDGNDRPVLWIELGGQLESIDGGNETFVPPFMSKSPRPDFETIPPLSAQSSPKFSNGGDLALSFQPDDSQWIFSANFRYGRLNGDKHVFEQTSVSKTPLPANPNYLLQKRVHKFADANGEFRSTHTILDFQAGREVGLGMGGESAISLGVRFVQFTARSDFALHERPDYGWKKHFFYTRFYHNYAAYSDGAQSFHGIGPSLSWKASTPILHVEGDTGLMLDWGVNAAVLFGRQKAATHHSTKAGYFQSFSGYAGLYQHQTGHSRAHSVTVPNIGGFAGMSYKFPNAKIAVGYRADMFFGAMDGGIDTEKKENRGFYGPFASVSFGIGG